MGLAVQNFHDVRQEIAPAWLTTDRNANDNCDPQNNAAWPILLLPFMEQGNVYELVELSSRMTQDPGSPTNRHRTVRQTSIPTYFCPSRRAAPALTTNPGGGNAATVGDYAAIAYAFGANTRHSSGRAQQASSASGVNRTRPRTWDSAMLVCRAYNRRATNNPNVINGFQIGTLGGRDFRSMTTFASVLDGLSNTAFIGEKAVHKDHMGNGTARWQDGIHFYGNTIDSDNRTRPGDIAWFTRRLGPRNTTERLIPLKPTGGTNGDPNNDPQFRFGSWHPGVSLFLLGDGSVRQVSNSTSGPTLQRLGTRNDRLTFDLP
jgi:hypothetical protein